MMKAENSEDESDQDEAREALIDDSKPDDFNLNEDNFRAFMDDYFAKRKIQDERRDS